MRSGFVMGHVGRPPVCGLAVIHSLAFLLVFSLVSISGGFAQAAPAWSAPREGDYIAKDFHFKDGSVLPELRLHYRVLGQPHRDSSGHVDNAVLILHGTGGAGTQFLILVSLACSSFLAPCLTLADISLSCPTTSVETPIARGYLPRRGRRPIVVRPHERGL